MKTKTFITKEEIDGIVNQENLLVRNLQSTQGYYDVSQGLRRFVSRKNMNWFSFGTWASKGAGRAIRHETLPKSLKSALIRSAGFKDTFLFLHNVLEEAGQHEEQQADKCGKISKQIFGRVI